MAAVNPPLYLDQDDAYGAADLGLPFRDILGEGIVASTDLAVTAGSGLNSSVAAGAAWIAGDDSPATQPCYRVRNDAAVTIAHDAADATNPRIDLVIAEVLDATFSGVSKLWRLRAVKGTPAGAPVAPALPVNAIKLAEVRVNAGSGTLTSVTDKRTRASVGGGSALGARGELAYAQFVANVVNAQPAATAGVIVTAGAVLLDGATSVIVEFQCPAGVLSAFNAGDNFGLDIWQSVDGATATSLGCVWLNGAQSASASPVQPVYGFVRLVTPAAGSYVFSARGWRTGPGTITWEGGAGGAAGTNRPGSIRVTRF